MEKKLLFTGDSITDCGHMFESEGLGDGYVRRIQQQLPGDTVINRGYDGYIASRVCRVWEEICIKQNPDVVTLLIGVNDACEHYYGTGYDVTRFGEYLIQIIGMTKEATDARIILMEPFIFPWPESHLHVMPTVEAFAAEMRNVAAEYQVEFIPTWDYIREAQKKWTVDDLSTDGIHLSELGHEILAQIWLSYYQP